MSSLEKRYAEALLSMSENAQQADTIGTAIGTIGRLFLQNEDFRGLILNPDVTRQVRSEMLQGVLKILGYIKEESEADEAEAREKILMLCADADGDEDDDFEDAEKPVADAGLILLRFLQLLMDRGRLSFIPFIAEEYLGFKAQCRKHIRINVRSSTPFPTERLEKMRKKYMLRYGAEDAEIENVIEPSIIGGLSVHIGGMRIDDTLYGRYAALARVVAEGAAMQTAEAV